MSEPGVFSDLLVIELASVLAGPSVGMFFAELGASVIKVEHFQSGGDVTRNWKLAADEQGFKGESQDDTVSAYFSAVNWGKQSIGLNLAQASGKSIVYDLIRKADVVISSYKSGDAEKLGMDAATLRALNSKIIYASITAYGENDPRTGFDAIIQAEAGFMHLNGTAQSGPLKMPVALMDILAAHQLKEAVLIALYKRMKSGQGCTVTTSLLSSGISALANQAANYLVAGKIPGRMGSGHPNIVPYGSSYITRDGKTLVIAAGNDRQFESLCEVLNLQQIKINPDYSSNPLRVKNRNALEGSLKQAIASFDLDPLLKDLLQKKVPAGAVLNMEEVFAQALAQQMLLQADSMRGLRTIAFDLENENKKSLSAPPQLCADSMAVMSGLLGYSAEQMDLLIREGVVQHG